MPLQAASPMHDLYTTARALETRWMSRGPRIRNPVGSRRAPAQRPNTAMRFATCWDSTPQHRRAIAIAWRRNGRRQLHNSLTCSPSRPLTSSATFRSRVRLPSRNRIAYDQSCHRYLRDSLHVMQEDRAKRRLALGSRGGIAVRYHFPADGIPIKFVFSGIIRTIGRAWMGEQSMSGSTKLVKRSRLRKAEGRPRARVTRGRRAGYAGAPEWKDTMQVEGDRGSSPRPVESRTTVACGFSTSVLGPEGLPNRCSADGDYQR